MNSGELYNLCFIVIAESTCSYCCNPSSDSRIDFHVSYHPLSDKCNHRLTYEGSCQLCHVKAVDHVEQTMKVTFLHAVTIMYPAGTRHHGC